MKNILLATALLGSAMAAPVAAQTVNVDGVANASLDGGNAVTGSFGPGTYRYTFTSGLFTAFSRFSGSAGCNAVGARCSQGFENSVRLLINGAVTPFGDGQAAGGIGPQTTGGYYDTAAQSFAASSKYVGFFTLTDRTNVGFFLYDDVLSDNRGGVSIAVAAVPEPTTWGMMILGFGAVGFAMRRRAKVRTNVSFG